MSRNTTRWLTIFGLILAVLAMPFVIAGLISALAYSPDGSSSGGVLLSVGLVLAVAGVLTLVGAAVGALIKLNQLRQYGWFWAILGSLLLVFVGVGFIATVVVLLVYSFDGPTTPASPSEGTV